MRISGRGWSTTVPEGFPSRSLMALEETAPTPAALATSSCRASFEGSQRSSLSRKAIHSPRASRIPRLRGAAGQPDRGPSIQNSLGSAIARTRARLSSVEPSSQTRTSKSVSVWRRTSPTASTTAAARFQVGMITLTRTPMPRSAEKDSLARPAAGPPGPPDRDGRKGTPDPEDTRAPTLEIGSRAAATLSGRGGILPGCSCGGHAGPAPFSSRDVPP